MLNRILTVLSMGLILLTLTGAAFAADTARKGPSVDFTHGGLKVSENGRYLVHQDGTPFYYNADTAWLMFHRLTRDQIGTYMENRRAKGFTVIQTLLMSSWGQVIFGTNANGDRMFIDGDPLKPNEAYFKQVDYAVDKALEKGLTLAIVVVWGDLTGPGEPNQPGWDNIGTVTERNARSIGAYVGARYKDKPNIIWALGGDRTPKGRIPVWRELAAGLKDGDGGRHLITYHPNGQASSSELLHKETWLDFNMQQTSHYVHNPQVYSKINQDYNRKPVKPVVDGEPPYERAPVSFNSVNGRFDDYDARQAAYWAVFSGAFGNAYGCNDIWQLSDAGFEPFAEPQSAWFESLDLAGAWDMKHIRDLMESRPFLSRVPDSNMITRGRGTGGDVMRATRGDGYLMAYSPTGKPFSLDLSGTISGDTVRAYWFDPREGTSTVVGDFPTGNTADFTPPTKGRGNDWVLVVDDVAKGFAAPGTQGLFR